MAASLGWTLSLVALTEILSVFNFFSQHALALGWCAIGTAVLIIYWLRRERGVSLVPSMKLKQELATIRQRPSDCLLLAGAGVICLSVGITALISPPNGSDQLQYHMPRVAVWAARHTVAFFPTHYYAQLFSPPLAEWMMLHSYVLSGGDRFVNLVQWLCFVGSAVCMSLVAKELGADSRGQLLTAIYCVTLPQGVLAASGAKNDWVLSFWLGTAVLYLLKWRHDRTYFNTCAIGVAVGATLLSKGSAYVFLPPVFAACIIVILMERKVSGFLKHAAVFAVVVIVLNAPQWWRNYGLAHSIFGMSTPDVAGKDKYTVDRTSVSGTVANVLRELAVHFGTPSDKVNREVTKMLKSFIRRFGVDPDDPSFTNYSEFYIPHYGRIEYDAGNPLHLLLTLAAFVLILAGWRRQDRSLLLLTIGIIGAFVFYCAVFKWEVWCSRLQLPLFVLSTAIVAAALYRSYPVVALIAGFILLVAALPAAFSNPTRPLLFTFSGGFQQSIFARERKQLYFSDQPRLAEKYISAAAEIRDERCNDIGVDTEVQPFSHEYPLFALSRSANALSNVRYVSVHNLSAKFAGAKDLVKPCVVICPGCRDHAEKWAQYAGAFPQTHVFGDLVVFSDSTKELSKY